MYSSTIDNNVKFPVRPWLLYLMALGVSFDYRFLAGVSGAPSFTVLELMYFLASALFFLDFVVFPKGFYSTLSNLCKNNVFFVLYVCWTLVAAIANTLNGAATTLQQFKDLLPSFFIVVIIFFYLDKKTVSKFLFFLAVGFLLNIILGTAQGILGYPRPVPMAEITLLKLGVGGKVVGDTVATGFFAHPNGFAIYLLTGFICVFPFIAKGIKLNRWSGWLLIAIVSLVFFCFFKTQAKSAMVWSLASMFIYFVSTRLTSGKWLFCLFFTLLLSMGLVALGVYGARYYESFRTIMTRIQLGEAGFFAVFNSYWNFFLGGAQFDTLKISAHLTSHPYPNAHNGFINQAVLYGAPALFLFLGMLLNTTFKLARLLSSENDLTLEQKQFFSSVLVVIFALSGAFLFEPFVEGVLLQAQFFVFIGLAMAVVSNQAVCNVSEHRFKRSKNEFGRVY